MVTSGFSPMILGSSPIKLWGSRVHTLSKTAEGECTQGAALEGTASGPDVQPVTAKP